MTTVTYTPEEFFQSRQSGDESNIQKDFDNVLAQEKRLLDLQLAYIKAVDQYYEHNHPFINRNNSRPPEKQDMECFVRLIRQCMCSNNTYLLQRWGIDYVEKNDVLAESKDFYQDFFKDFSNSDNCLKVGIGVTGAAYFKYLYDNFPTK